MASFKDNHLFSSNSAGDLFGMVKQPFQRLLVASNWGIKLGHGLKHVVVCCLLCFFLGSFSDPKITPTNRMFLGSDPIRKE